MPASDGDAALELAEQFAFDSIILDVGLPVLDGCEVARAIKARSGVPILMLTARDAEDDVLRGFDHGADDYLTKPFSFRELLARIEVLARPRDLGGDALLRLDPARLVVHRDQAQIQLTRSEYLLMAELHSSQGVAVKRQRLMEAVWESPGKTTSKTLDVLMNALRAKVDLPFHDKLLVTVRGVGYCLQLRSPSGSPVREGN